MHPNITALSAELTALYSDEPHLHRIDPFALAAIEASGGTFNFSTGEVELPPARCPVPVVGVIDSHTGAVRWHNAAAGKRLEDNAPWLYFQNGQEYIQTPDGQKRRIDRDNNGA